MMQLTAIATSVAFLMATVGELVSAASFNVVVNGTASHAIPETLCGFHSNVSIQKKRLISCGFVNERWVDV